MEGCGVEMEEKAMTFTGGDRRKSRVTKHHGLAGTFLVSALKVSCPGKPLGPEPTTIIGHLRSGAGREGLSLLGGVCNKETRRANGGI